MKLYLLLSLLIAHTISGCRKQEVGDKALTSPAEISLTKNEIKKITVNFWWRPKTYSDFKTAYQFSKNKGC